MTKSTHALLIVLLVCASSAKLLHSQASAANDTDYLDALTAEETQLQDSLTKIQENIKYLHENLNQLDSMPDQQVVALEDALADETTMLSDLQQNTALPLGVKSVGCVDMPA